MAKTQNQSNLIVAYLKCTYYDSFHNLRQEATVYKRLINSSKDKMDLAIVNMAQKYGMIKVESIKPEEYEEATGESISQIQISR